MERKLLCQLFTATNCSTLARHALKLICQTTFDSVLFKSLLSHAGQLSWRHGGHVTKTRDFQLQTTQLLEASCLFSFKSILLRTSGECQSIRRTAWMLNFIYIVQSKWYLRLKISVQGPLMSSDVSWHIRDKLWPMPKHGSIILYVHGNQKARQDGQPRTSTSTFTQLLSSDCRSVMCCRLCFCRLWNNCRLRFCFVEQL